MLSLVDGVNCHIEKFVAHQTFKFICENVHEWIESCVKYSDYLSQNKGFQANHHNTDDKIRPTYDRKFFELPVTPLLTVYKTKQEHDAIQLLLEHLENKIFMSLSVEILILLRDVHIIMYFTKTLTL